VNGVLLVLLLLAPSTATAATVFGLAPGVVLEPPLGGVEYELAARAGHRFSSGPIGLTPELVAAYGEGSGGASSKRVGFGARASVELILEPGILAHVWLGDTEGVGGPAGLSGPARPGVDLGLLLGLLEVGPIELGLEWALRVFDPGDRAIPSHAFSAYIELTLPG
jgi:hypothetical protein